MPHSNDERKREKKVVKPGSNPYTITNQSSQNNTSDQNNPSNESLVTDLNNLNS